MTPDLSILKKLFIVIVFAVVIIMAGLGIVTGIIIGPKNILAMVQEARQPDNIVLWQDEIPTPGSAIKTGEQYLLSFTVYDFKPDKYHKLYIVFTEGNQQVAVLALHRYELEPGRTYICRVVYLVASEMHLFSVIQVVDEVEGYMYGPNSVLPADDDTLKGQWTRVIGDTLRVGL